MPQKTSPHSPDRDLEESERPCRPRRRAAARFGSQRPVVSVDPAYYLGYADDDETPEMIMRKFEALERLQAAKASQTNQEVVNGENQSSPKTESGATLTAAEQAELFRQTSYFSVDMLANMTARNDQGSSGIPNDLLAMGSLDDSAFERVLAEYGLDAVLFGAGISDVDQLSDYDDDDLLWDEASESERIIRFPGRLSRARSERSESNRVAIELWKARAALMMRLSAGGDALAAAQAAAMIPAALRVRRRRLAAEGILRDTIPAEYPLPTGWARTIKPFREVVEGEQQLARNHQQGRIIPLEDLLRVPGLLCQSLGGRRFRCVVLDPPLWADSNFRVERLRSLQIHEIVPYGFVFIWVPKTRITETLHWFSEEASRGGGGGFQFVESFCVVYKWTNNRIAAVLSTWLPPDASASKDCGATSQTVFSSSHETCLLLRRQGPHIELAHQRNPDLCYDFVPLRRMSGGCRRPEFFYHLVETMLPEVARDGDMLCIWADQTACMRSSWVSVVQGTGREPSVADSS